jgi:bacterioferritin-associated ferredoxin
VKIAKLSLDGCCGECGRLRRQLIWSGAANRAATLHAARLEED